jgi:hypothetical protein
MHARKVQRALLSLTVFVKNHVSVTCKVESSGQVCCQLVVESGKGPGRCVLSSCQACSQAEHVLRGSRRARLVVKTEGYCNGQLETYVALSSLDAESLALAQSSILPCLVKSSVEGRLSLRWSPAIEKVFHNLNRYMCSTWEEVGCGCAPFLPCRDCGDLFARADGKFLWLRSCDSLSDKALSANEGDFCFSDAVGMLQVQGKKRLWLTCGRR